MRQGGEESSLAFLIERSAELKRDLVRFAQSPRFERWLVPAMLEAADSDGELDEAELIGVIDRFALQHRLRAKRAVAWSLAQRQPDARLVPNSILIDQ